MFGPEGYGGIKGVDGSVTVVGGALAGKIAYWQIRRVGSRPEDRSKPILQFRAHFSWKSDVLMRMCQRGELTGRVRVFKKGRQGEKDEQVDIVKWAEWRMDEDGVLILEDVLHFDTQPIRQ